MSAFLYSSSSIIYCSAREIYARTRDEQNWSTAVLVVKKKTKQHLFRRVHYPMCITCMYVFCIIPRGPPPHAPSLSTSTTQSVGRGSFIFFTQHTLVVLYVYSSLYIIPRTNKCSSNSLAFHIVVGPEFGNNNLCTKQRLIDDEHITTPRPGRGFSIGGEAMCETESTNHYYYCCDVARRCIYLHM